MISLPAADQQRLIAICERHDVRLLVVFGSHATGRTHAASALDLAVLQVGGPRDETSREMSLWGDLQTIFSRHRVDIVWLHRADVLLLFHIFRDAQLLFGARETLLRYELYAWKRFVEYQRFFAAEAAAVRGAIERRRRAG